MCYTSLIRTGFIELNRPFGGLTMAVGLGWLGVGVGIIGLIVCLILGRFFSTELTAATDTRRSRLAVVITILFTIVLWAIAMQRQLSFSRGQALGWGFLIGGLAGACAIFNLSKLKIQNEESESTHNHAMIMYGNEFLGLFGVSLTYLLFAGNPRDALLGFAMGCVMAAIIGSYAGTDGYGLHCGTWIAFTVTLTAAILLAIEHFDQTQLRMWWPLPILLGATVLIAGFTAFEITSLGRFSEKPGVLAAVISAVTVLALSTIYAWRLFAMWQLLEVVAVGIVIAAVIAWLYESVRRSGDDASRIQASAGAVLLVLAFTVITFKLWAGLGLALGLIGAWSVVLPIIGCSAKTGEYSLSSSVLQALLLGLIIILFRLFIQQYRHDLGTTDLRIHYTFIGALLGAVLPFILHASLLKLDSASNENDSSDIPKLAGIILLGLLAAASPVIIYILWEIKAVLGLSFGFTAAAAFLILGQMQEVKDVNRITLYMIAAQLAAVQFTGPLTALNLTRTARAAILGAVILIFIAWTIISGIIASRRAR